MQVIEVLFPEETYMKVVELVALLRKLGENWSYSAVVRSLVEEERSIDMWLADVKKRLEMSRSERKAEKLYKVLFNDKNKVFEFQ